MSDACLAGPIIHISSEAMRAVNAPAHAGILLSCASSSRHETIAALDRVSSSTQSRSFAVIERTLDHFAGVATAAVIAHGLDR